jgi:hypothetical protein
MALPFTHGVPIPAILFDSLEATLQASMRLLVKDIAASLRESDAPLWKAIKDKKVAPYIFEESADKDIDMRCPYMTQGGDTPAIIKPCGQPVIWSSGIRRCPEHAHSPIIRYPSRLPSVRILDHTPPMFVSEDNTVYDGEMNPVGQYDGATQNLYLFKVSE